MQPESIKREIFKNGPVIGQMQPFTDFLAYKEGSYHKTNEAFKFNGQHIVKIVGWSSSIDGGDEWIIENTWGDSWGEKGYGKIIGGRGDTNIELFSLGASVVPYTVYDYYSMQNMQQAAEGMGDGADYQGEEEQQEGFDSIYGDEDEDQADDETSTE